jgi:hypothetical protein
MLLFQNGVLRLVFVVLAMLVWATLVAHAWEPSERTDADIYQPPGRLSGQYHDGTIYGPNNEPKYYIHNDKIYDAKDPGHVVYQIVPKSDNSQKK